MKKRILSIISAILVLVCTLASCGGDNNENTTHTHSYGEWETTKTLTSIECYNEVVSYLNATKNLKSISQVEGKYVYSIYFDGEKTFLGSTSEKEGSKTERWYGKVGAEYVKVVKKTSSDGSINKYYEVISESDFNEYIESFKEDIFDSIDDFLYIINEGENFECLKTTSGDKVTYLVKANAWGSNLTEKLEITNGVITRCVHIKSSGDNEITFPTDIVVTIPDLSSYEKN